MKFLAVPILACCIMLTAACSPIKKKTTTENSREITRTYFMGIPVAETSKWSDDDIPEGTAGRMRQMEEEMRQGDKQIQQPSRGSLTP